MRELTRLIAFDFGMKSIGVAYGQMITKTAQPLTALTARQGSLSREQVAALLKTWAPHALIVGLPLNMDGSEQPITTHAKAFADWLSREFGLPVFLSDERLTTKEARERLFTRGGYKALDKSQIDALSAAIILDSWMNNQKPTVKN